MSVLSLSVKLPDTMLDQLYEAYICSWGLLSEPAALVQGENGKAPVPLS